MATMLYQSANYRVDLLRVGATLRSLNGAGEVYFQPGDATAALLETLAALEELPEPKRETVFDIAMGEYF